jgi:hypothetical protein
MFSLFQRQDNQSGAYAGPHTGRFTDAFKNATQIQYWEKAINAFEHQDYVNSVLFLMGYLNDEAQQNIHWHEVDGILSFEFCQGSNLIKGSADSQHIRAETKLALVKAFNPAFMRRLVEHNADFNYCRFALDEENCIVAVFDSFCADASPYKIYYALKEMATNADKLDDLLLDEFPELIRISGAPRTDLPAPEKEFKYQYIKTKISLALHEIDHGPLDKNQFPGGIGYILLSLVFKLDYLIQPQGYMMETLERITREYFAYPDQPAARKNLTMAAELRALANRSQDDFFKEMYRVSYTFGITKPVALTELVSFFESELPNMDWYAQQGFTVAAQAIPDFLAAYSLFNYAQPEPIRNLLHLYFLITESGFFQGLDLPGHYIDSTTQQLLKGKIINAVRAIETAGKKQYPTLQIPHKILVWHNMVSFSKSYILMIKDINMD